MCDSHVLYYRMHLATLISVTIGDGYVLEEYEL